MSNFIRESVEILGYIDNHNKSVGKYLIISEEKISNYLFDYIVVTDNNSEQNLIVRGISKHNILNLHTYIHTYIQSNKLNPYFHWYLRLYKSMEKAKQNKTYEIIVIGLSYGYMGIVPDLMKKETLKLTVANQDFYYDYLIAKSVLSIENNVKYCIMGVGYYCFDYDLSLRKSLPLNIPHVYYPIFKDAHHFILPDNYSVIDIENINYFTDKALTTIFKDDFCIYCFENILKMNLTLNPSPQEWEYDYNEVPIRYFDEKTLILKAEKYAREFDTLNHPETVIENKKIFKNYLELLNNFNIEPIIVIFPVPSICYNYLDKKREDRFYSIIREMNRSYNFQLIDMFRCELFNLEDFRDFDHLNRKGATKMTNLLNDLICFRN